MKGTDIAGKTVTKNIMSLKPLKSRAATILFSRQTTEFASRCLRGANVLFFSFSQLYFLIYDGSVTLSESVTNKHGSRYKVKKKKTWIFRQEKDVWGLECLPD